jgi:prevent-host-death family protein
MPKVLNITAARSRLTSLVQEAFLEHKRTLIGKHGVPMAALLPIREYEELLQDLEDLRDMLQAEQEYRRTGGKDFEDVVKKLKGRR